jgi:hypothetical protein
MAEQGLQASTVLETVQLALTGNCGLLSPRGGSDGDAEESLHGRVDAHALRQAENGRLLKVMYFCSAGPMPLLTKSFRSAEWLIDWRLQNMLT